MTRAWHWAALAALAACRKGPADGGAPRFVVGVGPARGFTVLTATFLDEAHLRYRDAHCTAVPLRDGAEPAALDAGRVESWVVAGPILGHVDRGANGAYQAAIRAELPAGTRLAASVAGSAVVPAHRFRSPAKVPAAVERTEPSQGFRVTPGQGLPVRWRGGDGSHVSITLSLEAPGATGAGLLVSCVVPREPGAFTIPAAALAASRVPEGAAAARLAVASTDRVREGDYALDVVLVGSEGDEVAGSVAR